IINSCLQFGSAKLDWSRVTDFILQIDHFDLVPKLNPANLSQIDDIESNLSEQKDQIKKAKLLRINTEFKSFCYLYPISLKYDTQKVYSRARNILIKIEFRDRDIDCLSTQALNCIFKTNSNLNNLNSDSNSCLVSCYKTIVTHHNKTPQFYDEIKILLPLNLHEKHHILFKFYHISCNNAKTIQEECDTSLSESITNISGKNVESLIGFSWLPVFKNGKLFDGEKSMPIAQNLPNEYLSFEQIGLGQSIGPSDIKWIDNMKLLFKINLLANTTVHTIDPHVANFYSQYEKLNQSVAKPTDSEPIQKALVQRSMSKRKAPLIPPNLNVQKVENKSEVENEICINSVKLPITMIWSKPVKEELSLSLNLKALHATEISTIVKYMPTLFNRILSTFVTTVSTNVAIHAVRALLHFVWQMTLIGKLDNLKSFIKYMFHVDYTGYFAEKNHDQLPTLHHELITNLVDYLKDNANNLQNQFQTHRFLTNCWFFMELVLKSLALYTIQYKKNFQKSPIFSQDFYKSVKDFFDLLIDLLVKHASVSNSKEKQSLISAVQKCNRTVAMFIKKSLNLLNKKQMFTIINRYLDATNISDKIIHEIKLDFIRIVCNHEHYIAFSLPTRKAVTSIHDFAE
ncbi:dedicator of cytokinesis 9-like, partial [Brachionus plicatilis]